LVLERKALRGRSHTPRCSCGPLRTHDCRRLHRGDLTVGGFIGAGASPDIKHGPRIAERSPDLRGDPWLGAPRHGVGGSVPVVKRRAGNETRKYGYLTRWGALLPLVQHRWRHSRTLAQATVSSDSTQRIES